MLSKSLFFAVLGALVAPKIFEAPPLRGGVVGERDLSALALLGPRRIERLTARQQPIFVPSLADIPIAGANRRSAHVPRAIVGPGLRAVSLDEVRGLEPGINMAVSMFVQRMRIIMKPFQWGGRAISNFTRFEEGFKQIRQA